MHRKITDLRREEKLLPVYLQEIRLSHFANQILNDRNVAGFLKMRRVGILGIQGDNFQFSKYPKNTHSRVFTFYTKTVIVFFSHNQC